MVKRKARKTHECNDCGCMIYVNEEYYVITYKGDDFGFHTAKLCEGCWSGKELSANNKIVYGGDEFNEA